MRTVELFLIILFILICAMFTYAAFHNIALAGAILSALFLYVFTFLKIVTLLKEIIENTKNK